MQLLTGVRAFLALALLCLAPFANAQEPRKLGGDETVGVLPASIATPEMQALEGSVDFVCVRSRVANAPTTIHRRLAGEPGTIIKISRGPITLVAVGDPCGGTEDAIAPPEPTTVSWHSGSMTVTVTVYPQPGETPGGLTIRLAARVNALKKSFPDTGNHP